MAYSRFRDRSGLVTRRRVIAYLQRERERYQDIYDPGDDSSDSAIYLVDDNDNYIVDDSDNYIIVNESTSNGQSSLI